MFSFMRNFQTFVQSESTIPHSYQQIIFLNSFLLLTLGLLHCSFSMLFKVDPQLLIWPSRNNKLDTKITKYTYIYSMWDDVSLWIKLKQGKERGKGVWRRVIMILNKIVREVLTMTVMREQEIWKRAFQAECKASTKSSRLECTWYIQRTARGLVVWLEWQQQDRKC